LNIRIYISKILKIKVKNGEINLNFLKNIKKKQSKKLFFIEMTFFKPFNGIFF